MILHGRGTVDRSLDAVDGALRRPLRSFMIGGGALAIRGLKDATKDVDHVVATDEDYRILSRGLLDAGFTEIPPLRLKGPYPALAARGIFEQEGHPQWDVFVGVVARKLRLSQGMIMRAEPAEPPREMLKVHLLANEDILVFKSVAGRVGDKEDMERILLTRPDWDAILDEMRWQCRHSETAWSVLFCEAMEDLGERYAIPILDELADLADQDVLDKHIIRQIREGADDPSLLSARFADDLDAIDDSLRRLIADGWIIPKGGRLSVGPGPLDVP